MDFKEIAGIVAGVLSVIAFIPYILSILKGETKPARATWLIFSLTAIITLVSYREAVSDTAIWIAWGYVIGAITVSLFSIKYGVGGWENFDRLALSGCFVTLGIWVLFKSSKLALLAILATDLMGLLPTMKKTVNYPKQENSLSWIISTIASLISLLVVREWAFIKIVYPIYLAISSGTIAVLSLRKEITLRI